MMINGSFLVLAPHQKDNPYHDGHCSYQANHIHILPIAKNADQIAEDYGEEHEGSQPAIVFCQKQSVCKEKQANGDGDSHKYHSFYGLCHCWLVIIRVREGVRQDSSIDKNIDDSLKIVDMNRIGIYKLFGDNHCISMQTHEAQQY